MVVVGGVGDTHIVLPSPPHSYVSNYLPLFEADIFAGKPALPHRTLLPFPNTFLVAAGQAPFDSIYTLEMKELLIHFGNADRRSCCCLECMWTANDCCY